MMLTAEKLGIMKLSNFCTTKETNEQTAYPIHKSLQAIQMTEY